MNIAMLLYPRLTQLDLTGPFEVLSRLPDARVHVVAKTRDPVTAEGGLTFLPSATFAELPSADLLFVPGGGGQIDAIRDPETLAYVTELGQSARWVTSACTGALLLGAAGLLRGYRAATHWAFMDLLPIIGAIPVEERVVVDRNRITGGGVTAGIDIALTIAAEVAGRDVAEALQLHVEYDPHPPFSAGHPRTAAPELVKRMRTAMSARYEERCQQLEAIAKTWS
jgi:cyclohexyl-isocyanide hydratase